MTRSKNIPAFLVVLLAATVFAGVARADVQLPAIISDHMVLQKAAKVPIWGKATPGEQVTVILADHTAKTVADANGKWEVVLNLEDSAPGPFKMTVEGKNTLILSDVVIGEVWVASGQSNMQLRLRLALGLEKELSQPANPQLRQFLVQNNSASEPQYDLKGSWVAASPATVGDFSAVGYFFAKKLQNTLNLPVGLIHTSFGGTPVEAWTSAEAIDSVSDLKAAREFSVALLNKYPGQKKAFVDALGAWIKENGREDRTAADPAAYAGEGVSTEGWSTVKLPGLVTNQILPKAGAIWVCKEINVSAQTKDNIFLHLPINGFYDAYWNGKLVEHMPCQDFPGAGYAKYYVLPSGLVHVGKNTLAVRLYEPVGPAKFNSGILAGAYSLTGDWLAKAEYGFADLDARKRSAAPQLFIAPPPSQMVPGYLFNGMVHPLLPYAIRGVIWYQGEANAGRAYQYRTAFPLMITDWRKQWNQGDFPFYFCQLPNFKEKQSEPGESNWAELREAQSLALKLPNTGQAVIIDIGEAEDIHPRNKRDAGERLALIALARDYGKSISYSAPVYDSMKIESGKIILSFTHTDKGLVAKPLPKTYDVRSLLDKTAPLIRNRPNSQLEGFAICGKDQKWVWGDARIDGNNVIVWSDSVPAPVAVRYAWADNPTGNLGNEAGLPVSPFRTDDFTPITLNNKN